MHIVCVCCHQLFMCIFCLFVYFVSFFGGSNLRKYYALVFFPAGYIHVQELSICWKKNHLQMNLSIYTKCFTYIHCVSLRQFGRVLYIKNAFIEYWTLFQGFFQGKNFASYFIIIYCNQKFATS